MKMRPVAITLIFLAGALLVWVTPVIVGVICAKPLHGSFLVAECACGHEFFYRIDEEEAFEYSPAHKRKVSIGRVARTENSVIATRAKNLVPIFELKFENGNHYLRYLSIDDNDWNIVEQVKSPWRTHVRGYLPE